MPILRRSLDGLFDDAGLFPPARRSMADALATHDRIRSGPHGRLVGPFLCPMGRLPELEACVAGGLARPERLAVVIYPNDRCHRRPLARRGVVQVEAPFGLDLPDDTIWLRRFFELPHRGDLEAPLRTIAASGAGAKIRCGGPTPDLVPPVARLAEILERCADRQVPLKATGGVHRPFHGSGRDGEQHGFLNLLAAASAAVAGSGREDLAGILATGDDRTGTEVVARINRRVRELLVSVSTCTLEEPIAALQERGLL